MISSTQNCLSRAALEIPLDTGVSFTEVAEEIVAAGCRKLTVVVRQADLAAVSEAVGWFEKNNCSVSVIVPWRWRQAAEKLAGNRIWQIAGEAEFREMLAQRTASDQAVSIVWDGGEVWDIAGALQECREHGIAAEFGCTPAFAAAPDGVLHRLCGESADSDGAPFPGGRGCMAFVDGCLIKSNGDVWSCAGLEMVLGNIRDMELGAMLQNSSLYNFFHDWRENIKTGCRDCEKFGSCAGCRGRAYYRSGDFLGADPGCGRVDPAVIEVLPSYEPEKYMPHRPPMLMATSLLEVSDNYCRAESIIREDNPFLLPDGTLHSGALVEIGAQSMAFLDTFLHAGRPLQGMLVEIQSFEYTGFPVRPGCRIYCFGRKIYEMPPWNIGRFELYNGSAEGELIASGEIKVCQSQ